jgi:hypothetical protein
MTNSLGPYDHHLLASVRPGNKEALFDALHGAGITKVIVEFDGCGDSGQIAAITAFAGDDTIALPATTIEIAVVSWRSPDITRQHLSITEAIEHVVYNYLEEGHYRWENDDGAYGEFTFDVASRKVTLEFNTRYVEVHSEEYEF